MKSITEQTINAENIERMDISFYSPDDRSLDLTSSILNDVKERILELVKLYYEFSSKEINQSNVATLIYNDMNLHIYVDDDFYFMQQELEEKYKSSHSVTSINEILNSIRFSIWGYRKLFQQ